MAGCELEYIPQRLVTNDRAPINEFGIGELLFMRTTGEALDNPYKKISITELSHNRSGLSGEILSEENDVLYSIKADEPFEKYSDKVVCTLEIVSLNEQQRYCKEFKQVKNQTELVAILELLHEPEPCMYPHVVFRVWLDNQIVTYNNYRDTLEKAKQIRTAIKEELASMIRRNIVSQDDLPITNS